MTSITADCAALTSVLAKRSPSRTPFSNARARALAVRRSARSSSTPFNYTGLSRAFSASRVLAKGVDAVALKIREVATENDVPIVENRPLARALFDNTEIDEEIPEEYFKAVAEVISYVFKMNKSNVPANISL